MSILNFFKRKPAEEAPTPTPGPGEVMVTFTDLGMH